MDVYRRGLSFNQDNEEQPPHESRDCVLGCRGFVGKKSELSADPFSAFPSS